MGHGFVGITLVRLGEETTAGQDWGKAETSIFAFLCAKFSFFVLTHLLCSLLGVSAPLQLWLAYGLLWPPVASLWPFSRMMTILLEFPLWNVSLYSCFLVQKSLSHNSVSLWKLCLSLKFLPFPNRGQNCGLSYLRWRRDVIWSSHIFPCFLLGASSVRPAPPRSSSFLRRGRERDRQTSLTYSEVLSRLVALLTIWFSPMTFGALGVGRHPWVGFPMGCMSGLFRRPWKDQRQSALGAFAAGASLSTGSRLVGKG